MRGSQCLLDASDSRCQPGMRLSEKDLEYVLDSASVGVV